MKQDLNILYQLLCFWPFRIFDFFSETSERNSTKLYRKQDLNLLYQVCVFRADRKNKMAALASYWLRHFRLLFWNLWTEFNQTLQEARSQPPLPSLCFSGRSEKQDGRPGLWLAETFSTSFLKPLNGIQRNLTGSKISTSSTKFVFFGPIGKTRWPPWPLIGWDIFDFSSETTERNSTKLDRKQDLNVLYQVCVFGADPKYKMAALASDWLRNFRLLLWNRWTEFNETWQEARSQRPLPSLCFSGRSEKQDGRPGLWLAETFSTSPLKPLNGIQRNLTGSKISTSFSEFVFFGLISKQKCPPWPIPQKGGTLYSGARYVALWASCFILCAIWKPRWLPWPLIGWYFFTFSSVTGEQNLMKFYRKQEHNVLYQVSDFWTDWKTKMASLASDWLRHFGLLLCNPWIEFNESLHEARSQYPLSTFMFLAYQKTKIAALASDWLILFYFFLCNLGTEFDEILQEVNTKKCPFTILCFLGADGKTNMTALADSSTKVAHCNDSTQRYTIYDPFDPLFYIHFHVRHFLPASGWMVPNSIRLWRHREHDDNNKHWPQRWFEPSQETCVKKTINGNLSELILLWFAGVYGAAN